MVASKCWMPAMIRAGTVLNSSVVSGNGKSEMTKNPPGFKAWWMLAVDFSMSRHSCMDMLFTTAEMSEDVERFFTDHPAPAAERSIRQSLERIQINIAWLNRNRTELAARFGE